MDLTDISTLMLGVVAATVGLATLPKPKDHPNLVVTCLVLIGAAIATGLVGSLPSPSSGSSLTPPASRPPGQGTAYTPAPTTHPSQGAISSSPLPESSDYTKVSLGASSGMQATAYFGKLSSIVKALQGTASFNLNSTLSSDPQRCSLTVIITHVPGSTGAVYAQGLGPGWGAAETVPDSAIAGADESLHQQIVTPPADSRARTVWEGSASIQSDSATATTQPYKLELQSVVGSEMTWAFDGSEVVCGE